MRALVYTGPRRLELRHAPDPEPGGDALVRIAHAGICGSDLHAWAGHDERRPAPLILGHEAAGVVVAGSGSGSGSGSGPAEGARVAVNPLVACGACAHCRAGRENLCAARQIVSMPPREGAFAELLAVPPGNLVAVPDHVPTEHAALVEPIACGWHAVRIARRVLHAPIEEARCLVLGGGAIGLGAALVLAALGAREVALAEPVAERRAAAARAGPLRAFDPGAEERPRGAPPEGFDLVVDAVGVEATRRAACAAARPGGAIVHIGLGSAAGGVDARRLTLQEIALLGAYTYSAADFREAAAAIFEGRLGALDWIDVRPLSEGPRAFEDIASGRAAAPKIVLTP